MFWIQLLSSAQAQDVAITEFINDSIGPEPASEWVELFNYGPLDVDLSDFAIADEDSDSSLIPVGTVIPAGEFLILTNDPLQFVADWGVGAVGLNVIDVSMTIANSADELVLLDPAGGTVWSLAYDNDDTMGFTTWQTDPNLMTSTHGDQVAPGVDRDGDDNGVVGYLGYEDGANTVDPFAFTAVNGDTGSPFAGPYGAPPPMLPSLMIAGACPGVVDIIGTDLSSGGQVALLTANGFGISNLPGGPCIGVLTDLDAGSMTFRGTFNADGFGELILSPTLPAGACGSAVQLLDLTTCTVTNPATIP